MSNNFIHINIGRQVGAGGLELAHLLGNRTNIKVFDKELINIAAKESGFDPSFFEKEDEKNNLGLNNSFSLSSFVEAIQTGFGANIMSSGRLFKIQSDVIRDIANRGSTIFVGRCADYILRDYKNCINVFVCADIKDRVARIKNSRKIKDLENMSDEKIAEVLLKGDKQRASYYSDFSFKSWGCAESYHLTLNSSFFSLDECADIIEKYIKIKFL